jgi:hypothetical protein
MGLGNRKRFFSSRKGERELNMRRNDANLGVMANMAALTGYHYTFSP